MSAKNTKPEQGRLGIILDGIKKLYSVNPKFSWFLIIISLLSALSNTGLGEESNPSSSTADMSASGGEFLSLGIIFALLFALVVVIGIFVQGMISYATYSAINDKTPAFKEAYTATKEKFWILLEVTIRSALKIIGGLLLLIIPGIRAICRYNMAYVAVFDQKDASAKEVMDFSKKQTKDNLLIVFIMLVGSAIIMPLSAFIQYGGQVGIYPNLKNKLKA